MPAPKKSSRPTRDKQPTAKTPIEVDPLNGELSFSGATHGDGSRIERLRELVGILEKSSLAELAYEDEDIAVTLRRHSAVAAPPPVQLQSAPAAPAHHAPALHARPEPASRSAPAREDPDVFVVRSPFVGTFYRVASPTTPPFTEVNQHVRRGQTICIIEAMKLMNEIESEVDGTVTEVLVENAQSVQYGEALFRIRIKT